MEDHNYLFAGNLNPNDVILVLGAADGDFMLEHAKEILTKNVFVINVEPTLDGVNKLSSVIKTTFPQNACLISCAVSDKSGTEVMEVRDGLITSTISSRPETNQRWPRDLLYRHVVPVLTLDNIITMFPRIDKIFCDVEGSELEVFLDSSFIRVIPYVAIASYHIRDGQPTHIKLSGYFKSLGFSVLVTDKASVRPGEDVLFAYK